MFRSTTSGNMGYFSENEKNFLLIWFCVSSARHLNLGLTEDQLTRLYKECLEIAKHWHNIAEESNDKRGQMKACCLLLKVSSALCLNDEAILYGNKVVDIAEALGDDISKMKAYWSLRLVYYSSDRYTDALSCVQSYHDIAVQSGIKIINEEEVYLSLGKIKFALNEYSKAILNFKKSIDIAKHSGNKYCEMNAYLGLSRAYAGLQQYDEAVCHAKECIRIIQEISVKKATEMDDRSSLVAEVYIKDASLGAAAALAYFNLGTAEAHLALYDDSLDSFQKCAAIATEIGHENSKLMSYYLIAKLFEEKSQWHDVIEFSEKYIDKMSLFCDKEMEIEAYLRLTTALFHTSKYEEAVVYGKKSIETIGDSEDTSEYTKCVLPLTFLGLSYLKLKNYNEAINCGKKCLAIATNISDKEAALEAHYILASAYSELQQIDIGFEHASKGMQIAEERKNDNAMEKFSMLLSVYFAFVGMEEKVNSLNPVVKALSEVPTCPRQEIEALVKAVNAGDVDQQIRCQVRLHNYHKSKHQYQRAINCLGRIMALQPNCSETQLSCYILTADMYLEMKKYKEGLEYCEGRLREVSACKDKTYLFRFFFYISQLYHGNNNLQLAEKYIKEAIRCFETLYGSAGSNDDFKMSMVDKYNDCFRFLSLVYLQTNREKEALLILDKCRARVLKEILVVNYEMQENKGASDIKFSDIEALVSNNQFTIIYYSICGFGNVLGFLIGHNCFLPSAQQLYFDEEKYHQLIDKMFEEIEVLREMNCEDRTLDTEQHIKQQTEQEEEEGDKQKSFVFLSKLRKIAFVVTKKEILLYDTEKCRPATALEFLYCFIIGEGQSLIKQSEIIFIPDGSLCKIPFSALQDPDTGKYLSETKRIRLAPSIATLKLLSENAADYHCNAGGALIIGNPDVGKVMLNGEVEELSELQSAQKEASILAHKLGVEPLIGKEATKPAVLEKLQQDVSVVHIAAHGNLTKGTIALAPSPEIRATKIPDEEDYMLTMADVQQAKVRAQLVVLSCCHSGRGEIRSEGVVGMCRAFLASGARAVVASLWAIDDEATLEFMIIFYGHLKNGKSASTSLQLTMNEMRSIDEYKEPKYWAPFFLMGDDVTLEFN